MNSSYYGKIRGENKHPSDWGANIGIYQEAVLSILVYEAEV